MKTAIIFGVTGQDGSHLADLLLEKNYSVIGATRRTSTDNTTRISHILNNDNFKLVSGDITDSSSVLNIFKNHGEVDEVYNLAAQSHVAVSFNQPGLTWDITGKGCLNILQSLVDLNMMGARFYQASSSEMFGKNYDIEVGMTAESKYQNEETKFLPQSPYAIAKCAAHYMTRLYREGYGLHASAGILFNHEGPRRGENFVTRKITKWIGEFERWSQDAEFGGNGILLPEHTDMVRIYGKPLNKPEFPKLRLGNLDAKRDWGHAEDYVRGMWEMVQHETPNDYVVATGETHSVREFLDIAFKHIGIDDWEDFVVIDPEFYRPAEVDYLLGIPAKAKRVLGWEPEISFQQLVERMVDSDVEAERLQRPDLQRV